LHYLKNRRLFVTICGRSLAEGVAIFWLFSAIFYNKTQLRIKIKANDNKDVKTPSSDTQGWFRLLRQCSERNHPWVSEDVKTQEYYNMLLYILKKKQMTICCRNTRLFVTIRDYSVVLLWSQIKLTSYDSDAALTPWRHTFPAKAHVPIFNIKRFLYNKSLILF